MKIKKVLCLLSLFFVFTTVFAPISSVSAENDMLGLKYGESTGLGDGDVRITIAKMINIALSLLGVIMVIIVIYAGFGLMTSDGSEEKISDAKKRIFAAVIGLVIILSAYTITNFVTKQLYQATTDEIYR